MCEKPSEGTPKGLNNHFNNKHDLTIASLFLDKNEKTKKRHSLLFCTAQIPQHRALLSPSSIFQLKLQKFALKIADQIKKADRQSSKKKKSKTIAPK